MVELKIGDEVKCFNCGERFVLSAETYKSDWKRELVVCPHCEADYDVFMYLYEKARNHGKTE